MLSNVQIIKTTQHANATKAVHDEDH